MDQTKARERNHSLKITSGTYNPEQTVDEVGGFIMRNGVASEIEEDGTIEEIMLYMDDPEEIVRLTDDGMSVNEAASFTLIDYTLNDLIQNEVELRPSIEKYAMDPDNEYEHEIPLKVIKLDLHDLIVKEEITDLMLKNDRGALSKEDLLEYGQLVTGDSLSYDIGRELKETVEKILKEQGMEPDESEHMKSAFKSLSLDSNPDDFKKEKNRSSHLVPFFNNHLAVKNQKEIGISR